MKVIAKMDNHAVMCEVSREEMAWLNGFRTAYEKGCDIEKLMAVGAECNLKRMVNTSQFVRGMRSDTLVQTKAKLEQAINQLDNAMEVVSGLEVFNILSEEQQIG